MSIKNPLVRTAVVAVACLSATASVNAQDYSNWMAETPGLGGMTLVTLPIPGTHQSITYDLSIELAPDNPVDVADLLSGCNVPEFAGFDVCQIAEQFVTQQVGIISQHWGRNQGRNLTQQLQDGIRYLDVRVARRGDATMWGCHGVYTHNQMAHYFDQVRDFLDAHPQEIVLMKVRPESDCGWDGGEDRQPLATLLWDTFGSRMITDSTAPTQTLDVLWQGTGRLYVLSEDASLQSLALSPANETYVHAENIIGTWMDSSAATPDQPGDDPFIYRDRQLVNLAARRCTDCSGTDATADATKLFNLAMHLTPGDEHIKRGAVAEMIIAQGAVDLWVAAVVAADIFGTDLISELGFDPLNPGIPFGIDDIGGSNFNRPGLWFQNDDVGLGGIFSAIDQNENQHGLSWPCSRVNIVSVDIYHKNALFDDNGAPAGVGPGDFVPNIVDLAAQCAAELNQPPMCDAGGPYIMECNGSAPTVQLADASTDPNADVLDHDWSLNGCTGGSLDDATIAAPTFELDSLGSCSAGCDVDLTIDDGLETASCSATITIEDTTDPTVNCPANQTLECNASTDTSVAANGSAGGSDICDPSVDIASADVTVAGCGDTETISRTWTSTDDCGLQASCEQTITVVDTTDPSIDTAASNQTVECDGAGNGAALNAWLDDLGGADASDACDTLVSWSDNFAGLSNTCGATGSAAVTFTATDDCNNASDTTATFTIEDTTVPTIDLCPSTIYHESPAGSCTDAVSYSVTASDVCGMVTIDCVADNNGASNVTPTGGTFPVGETTVTCTATDDCGLTSTCEFDVVINDPPQIISVTPATQGVQYSDEIVPVVVTATDCGPASDLTLEFDAAAVPAGLDLSGTADACEINADDKVECTWTLVNDDRVLEPQGTYTIDNIKAVDPSPLDGATLKSSPAETITVDVSAENATIDFASDNQVCVLVAEDGSNSGVFSLTVDVQELFPEIVTDGGELPGDIGEAVMSMTLQPVGPGSPPVVGMCTPDNDPAAFDYDGILTVTCAFDDAEVNTYTAEATLVANASGDLYYSAYSEDVLVVFDPSLGFTTGGGHFYWPGTDDRTNFGYTMKYNNSGNKPKGSLLLIRHLPDGSKYRIKSNAINGLAIGTPNGFGWASFTGKCTYLEPGMDEPDGNHEFIAYVEDHGEPGTNDRFWLQTINKDGVIIPDLSMDEAAPANAELLDGGNIVVPH